MASIVPKAYVLEVGSDAFEQKPVGTGPYKVTAFEPTRSLTWDRFEDYYDPERGGHADGIDFEFNVDTNLGMLRIQQGELDLMADPVPAGMLQQLEDDPAQADNLKLGTINNVYYVTCSTKHPALQVLEARQAVAYAIDKEKLVRQLGGLGQEADGGLFSPLSPYYQPGLSAPYDPERAKALLAEAGFADGFEIEILSQPVDPQKTIAQAVQADLEAIGISAKASILPQEVWLERVFAYGPEMVLSQWELPYPHGSYVMDSAFTTTAIEAGCCNFSQWSDSRFDTLAEEARETSDEAQLVELYKEMDAYAVGEQALWIPVLYPGYAGLKSTRLQGYEVPGTPAGDVLFFANYWIQES
jgi:ABC-type transport system substrate-binding protein